MAAQGWVLDTCSLMNGRVLLGFVHSGLVRHVFLAERALDELRRLAVSGDCHQEARHGLMVLTELLIRLGPALEVLPRSAEWNKLDVDGELIEWAVKLDAWLLTRDGKLQGRAEERGVKVINAFDIEQTVVGPCLVVGDEALLVIEANGQHDGQGVGRLVDGSLVVVKGGLAYLGKRLRVVVTRVMHQTHSRTFFADPLGVDDDGDLALVGAGI